MCAVCVFFSLVELVECRDANTEERKIFGFELTVCILRVRYCFSSKKKEREKKKTYNMDSDRGRQRASVRVSERT